MRIIEKQLKKLIREALGSNEILRERPWSILVEFRMSEGIASDSEGVGPDGFSVIAESDSGKIMSVSIDTYWNPQAGDQSGNSLKVHFERKELAQTYVPTRFDDGKTQFLLISNAPVQNVIVVSHAYDARAVPIAYLVVPNLFNMSEDINFRIQKNGNGLVQARIVSHSNL
jgi:hypothetical protein